MLFSQWAKMISYLRIKTLKNHTLFRSTYLCSPYMGVLLETEEILSPYIEFVTIPGLDGPISDLKIEKRRFITQKLNGKYHDGKQILLLQCFHLVCFNNLCLLLHKTVIQKLAFS